MRLWSKRNKNILLVRVQTHSTTVNVSVAGSQKQGINLTHHPAIPPIGIYPKVLYSITKTFTQPY